MRHHVRHGPEDGNVENAIITATVLLFLYLSLLQKEQLASFPSWQRDAQMCRSIGLVMGRIKAEASMRVGPLQVDGHLYLPKVPMNPAYQS